MRVAQKRRTTIAGLVQRRGNEAKEGIMLRSRVEIRLGTYMFGLGAIFFAACEICYLSSKINIKIINVTVLQWLLSFSTEHFQPK